MVFDGTFFASFLALKRVNELIFITKFETVCVLHLRYKAV